MSDDQDPRQAPPHRSARRGSAGRGSGLLLLGLGLGAVAAAVATLRQRTAARDETSPTSELEMVLRDEQPWAYETSTTIFAPAGAIAGHLHDVGGLPGLVGPLDGPPMDRVDWTEPGGARLRVQVHARSGGGPSDVKVQIARGSRTGPLTALGPLENEVRQDLAALRKTLERA